MSVSIHVVYYMYRYRSIDTTCIDSISILVERYFYLKTFLTPQRADPYHGVPNFQLGSQVEKLTVLEQLEKVLITVDELVEDG